MEGKTVFSAIPTSFEFLSKRTKYYKVLQRLFFGATLVLIVLAIWGEKELSLTYWCFAALSAFFAFLYGLGHRSVTRFSGITVQLGDRNVEVHDLKGNVIKAVPYEEIHKFEEKQLEVSYRSENSRGVTLVGFEERLILIYYGEANCFDDLNLEKPKVGDVHYGDLVFGDHCIVLTYHEEAMAALTRYCTGNQ